MNDEVEAGPMCTGALTQPESEIRSRKFPWALDVFSIQSPELFFIPGDCDEDSDCDAGLLCYQRDFYYNTPPGCRPQVHAEECEQPINECDVVDKGATQTNFVGWTPSIPLTIKKSKFMT